MMTNLPLPQVRPLSDLRTNIGEITAFLDEQKTPVILTKHGRGKYVLLSVEDYRDLLSHRDLNKLLDEGLDDVAKGKTQSFETAMKEIRKDIGK